MKALLLLLAAGCMSPVMHFGGGASPHEAQHAMASKITPPGLVVDREWTGEISLARIRVWADDDYRAQNVTWKQTFQDELDYVNEVLVSQFGVRLVAEYGAWDRHVPEATLPDALQALEAKDAGDAFAVIGLTSALPLVSGSFELLGFATTPGRYLVLRGYADAGERAAFERAFRELTKDEREALHAGRRRHKSATMLLHELGHDLGAMHQPGETIMNAAYSERATGFDPASHQAILATLDRRLNRTPHHDPMTRPIDHPSVTVTVDGTGKSTIGGTAVDDATLSDLFRMSFADDPETQVVIRPAHDTPVGRVVEIMERAKAAGLQRLTIGAD